MRVVVLIVCFLVHCIYGNGQIISTVAGTGLSGYSGEGFPATAAKIHNPGQTIFDRSGNFYIPQLLGNRVSKVDLTGILTTIAGNGLMGSSGDGGLASSALLYIPNTVAIDSVDNIYICDNNNSRIRKIDVGTGIITTVAGNGTAGFSGDHGPATSAQLYYPAGICFDKKGNLIISDGNRRIRKVDPLGIITTYAGIGMTGVSGDGGPATAARCGAGVVCTDTIGNLYIADCNTGESRIAKIDTDGIITTFAGTSSNYIYNGDDIPATSANINPVGMAFDKSGNLIFADRYNHRVRKIRTDGIIVTIAGTGTQGYGGDGGTAIAAQFDMPQGIAVDICGNIYISDNNNSRIRKINMPPVLTIPSIMLSVSVSSAPIGTIITINATVSNAGSSYMVRWMNKGIEFATTTVPTVTYTKGMGIDTITARVVSTATYGCYDSTTSTPHLVSTSNVGLEQFAYEQGLQVYPNPAHDAIAISSSGTILHSISISNLFGREVVYKEGISTEMQLSIGHLPQGIYLVRVNGMYVRHFVRE